MKLKRHLVPLLTSALALSMLGCSSGGSSNPFAYPTAKDSNESGGGNDTIATATPFKIGIATQVNTNYPGGDKDVYAVELTAGVDYEFSADRLCPPCDTEIYLWDTDVNNNDFLDFNDDWIGYGSAIQYMPTVSGTYYVEVRGLDNDYEVTTYTFGARERVDVDGDGWSDYHDCNDNDLTIGPEETEIPGDGIDQDCTGHDVPVGTDTDIHETDDTPETAVTMRKATAAPREEIYSSKIFAAEGNLRTIDSAGAEDYMKVSVPAFSAIQQGLQFQNIPLNMSVFESDGTTPVPGGFIENTTATAQTFYFRFRASNGTDTGAYVPYYFSLGVDKDGDGYYTQEEEGDQDCDDTDETIFRGATETDNDGVDSNCDGLDNIAP